jgi:2-haloacid dehalogenase
VTAEALDWAMSAQSLTDPALRARLLALYDRLPAFPEVAEALGHLKATGYRLAILSNGTPAMLQAATEAAGIGSLFSEILSVEAVRIYKPATRVYALVEQVMQVPPAKVMFVSANGWDIAGAGHFGFRTTWVNRANAPEDRLPHRPQHTIASLTDLPKCLD